ncbi:MAG: putative membrane protein (Fun14 family) [Planctomycetota bacterium]|jgi:uncharacterized membrane protein (Fun14 family)
MTSTESEPIEAPAKAAATRRSFGTWLREMPRWKKVTTGIALAAAVLGGIMSLVTGDPAPADAAAGNLSGLNANLIPEQGGNGTEPGATAAAEPASRGIFRLGFSFIAGFSIGTFLRAVLKLAAIVLGFWLVVTFLLAYAGLVTVEWDQIDALWNQFFGAIESEWGDFQAFMLGSLPATGLAVTGLAIGLKRH